MLKRRLEEIDLGLLFLGPLLGSAPPSPGLSGLSVAAAGSTLGVEAEEGAWELFAETRSIWLGVCSAAGGESTGRPVVDVAPVEAVVTWTESVAVVDTKAGGLLIKGCLSSALVIEVGELLVPSSDFLGGRGAFIEVERRRSALGLDAGGGILMLALSVLVLSVSACGFLRRSAGLPPPSNEWADGARGPRRGGPVEEVGEAFLLLPTDEAEYIADIGPPSIFLSGEDSFVDVLLRDGSMFATDKLENSVTKRALTRP